jgi:hypothetical protein
VFYKIQAAGNKGKLAVFFQVSFRTASKLNMRSILYILAVILIVGWLLGVFAWGATGLIHILIVLAIISILLGIIRRA